MVDHGGQNGRGLKLGISALDLVLVAINFGLEVGT